MNPIDQLSTVRSAGRRMPAVWTDPDTEVEEVLDRPSHPCPGCGNVTSCGDVITKIFRVWWHHDCAQKYLRTEGAEEAWRVLGHQLAARPRDFNTAQTRAIVEQLVRISRGSAR